MSNQTFHPFFIKNIFFLFGLFEITESYSPLFVQLDILFVDEQVETIDECMHIVCIRILSNTIHFDGRNLKICHNMSI